MNHRYRFLVSILFLWLWPHRHAEAGYQPFIIRSQHFSTAQGLPNRNILTTGQDATGFIWIGTLENACRFDGRQFYPLPLTKTTRNNPFSRVYNVIKTDPEHNLWLFNEQPLGQRLVSIIEPGKDTAITFAEKFGKPFPFTSGFLITITPRNHPQQPCMAGIRYVAEPTGAVWQYNGCGRFSRFYTPERGHRICHLADAGDQSLLVTVSDQTGRQYQLLRLSPTGKLLSRQMLPARLLPAGTDRQGTVYLYRDLLLTESKTLLPAVRHQQLHHLLFRLPKNGALEPIPLSVPAGILPDISQSDFTGTRAVYDAFHNLVWLIGKHLLIAWHPAYGVVFDQKAASLTNTSTQFFNSILVDRTGAVWVTTSDGVLLLTLDQNRFERLLYVPDADTRSVMHSIRGIRQTGQALWVNAADLWQIDLQTGGSQMPFGLHSPVRPQTQALFPSIRTADGNLWMVSRQLVRLNPATQQTNTYPLPGSPYGYALWEAPDGMLWLGTDQGLLRFDPKTAQMLPFRRYNQYPELARNMINGFFRDPDSTTIWLASSSGLYTLDLRKGITKRFGLQVDGPGQLPGENFTFVHPDSHRKGVYWLATRGQGLIRWDRITGQISHFTTQNGLSDNTIYAIYEDNHQRLWLPSNYGLMAFYPETRHVQTFLPKDGITHEEFNLLAHYRSPDGKLYFGGLNGITAFYPDKIFAEHTRKAPLLVTEYRKLDAETGDMTDHLPDYRSAGALQLEPADRAFRLSFALLDYRHVQNTRLWYRITGWQDRWQLQNDMQLQINGLPAGTYELDVKIQSQNGQWLSDTLRLPVYVRQPVYLRLWFLLLSLGLLAALTGQLFRWRNRYLLREKGRLEAEVHRRTAQLEADKSIIARQAAELREHVALKSRFFANISHELRTPLTLLIGPIHHLIQHPARPANPQLLASMQRNARQLQSMINDILDLTKADAGQLTLVPQPAWLPAVIREITGAFQDRALYKNIRLQVELPANMPWLMVDVDKVDTVLTNLLANALRFTPGGGNITVSLTEHNDQIILTVRDSGTGIHPDDLPHIFERYFQTSQTDKPTQGGTGIGLALAREYCLLWGGTITADSIPGQGSCFTVTYPKVTTVPPAPDSHAALPDNIPPAPFRSDKAYSGKTILIAEDNPDIVTYLQVMLKQDFIIHTASNGQEALNFLQQQTPDTLPDLLITDLMMPDIDGLTLMQTLKERVWLNQIPVVVLSARGSDDMRLRAMRLGVFDYLTKPFVEEELVARINHLLTTAAERKAWQQAAQGMQTDEPVIARPDDWIVSMEQTIRKNLAEADIQVSFLVDITNMSERQLYRRIKEQTGLSPNQFIQEVRLKTAREWFETNPYLTMKEVSFGVGFQKPSYFARLFKQRFGIHPADFIKQYSSVPAE
ncbi:ATP-binding protein [Arsenicibacter rosenii]|uniref:histidine kinase n=1 Tax=Arsenicibacter rosenii TaxID=1750698 RepID=A0A1S2VAW3_9BACT|nr:ATP-binding protein [Arsenicibacter rosenii]OIN55799.1 hypothetical protein BLX24_28160 [Arsenicibacter rosenii]